MLSFHNDKAIKNKYVNRILVHQQADRIIQGTGWENGKGCAVGCTLENYDHSRYPIELGLPEWLARLEDRIFENLPKQNALLWPAEFLKAIPVGVDTEIVRHMLAIKRMDRLLKIQGEALDRNKGDVKSAILQTINAIVVIKSCHESEINKNHCDIQSAWLAAWSAADSAWSAAWSAAESAARSAESAARSAWSAADSAARSAAWSAVWKQEANDLIECLKSLEVKQ